MAEERLQRRLAAILAADVVGYSRLMGIDEIGTLKRLKTLRRGLIDPAIAAHAARIVKLMGDGVLVEFGSAVDAVACAIEIQHTFASTTPVAPNPIRSSSASASMSATSSSKTTISLAMASISRRGSKVSQHQAAYRFRRMLGGRCKARWQAKFVDGGEQSLKNIARPVRVYRVELGGEGTAQRRACNCGRRLLRVARTSRRSRCCRSRT